MEALAPALERRWPALASCLAHDLEAVRWWEPSGAGAGDLAGFSPEEALSYVPAAWWPRLARARDELAQAEAWPRTPPTTIPPTDDPALVAVIEHGATRERLRVTREHRPHDGIAAHRIGWLSPSPLQQSLLHTGRLVCGDPAALDAIPHWRPEQVDPLMQHDERKRQEAEDWLFTWHGDGLSSAARARWKTLRARSRSADA
jgi:hypothetical protein